MKEQFCLGFCYGPDYDEVVLIRKKRPAAFRGLLNGLGGRVEPREDPHKAMRREFKEECGLDIKKWREFARMLGSNREIFIFEACSKDIYGVQTMTDERVLIYSIQEILTTLNRSLPFVPALILAGRDSTKYIVIHSSQILEL